MDVQIAAAGERVVAAWTTFDASSRFGRGVIATSVSSDGGRTWRPGPNPADDGRDGDHAFIDLAADDRGGFHLAWLDARAGPKGLIHARSDDGGVTWNRNVIVDAETCECCWNTLATAPGGRVLLLYRDKNPRDMALAASADGGRSWTAPVPVGRFNWTFEGCPHVGGGLATAQTAAGLRAYAVVWTGRADAAGVYTLASPDGGKTWGAPLRLGDGTAWHADVAAAGERVTAVWDARAGDDTAVFASTSTDGGKTWPAATRLTPAGVNASYPRVVHTGKGFRAFWTEQLEGKPVQWRSRGLE
jgi:Neuraminidase (sialidase)